MRWILCPQPRGDWDKEVEGFSKRNDFAGAERAARRWVQMAPTDAMAHNGLAQALVGQKRYDEALTAAREALRLAPDHRIIHDRYTELLNVQGDRLTQQGRLRGAEDLYREARQVNPGEQRYLTDLRDNLLKQFQEALRAHDSRWGVEVARKLVHLEPSNPRHHIRLGRALIQTGDSAGGQAAFQEAVRRRNAVGRQ